MIYCSYAGLETKYKFHRTVKVAPGAVVAVWNSDSGVEHQPNEGQLVMKQGGFHFQDIVETALLDKDNEVAATREWHGQQLHGARGRPTAAVRGATAMRAIMSAHDMV